MRIEFRELSEYFPIVDKTFFDIQNNLPTFANLL